MMRLCMLCAAVGGSGCALDLPNEGTLDRTRILAARAEPAQPQVGQPFTVTSYAWSPSGTPTVVWCVSPACDLYDPLVVELTGLDWATVVEAERIAWRASALELGIVGVEPGMPVLAVAQPSSGSSLVTRLFAFGLPPEGDDVEQATLTLDLADGEPNAHPSIGAVRVDGVRVLDVVLGIDVDHVLDVALEDGSLQTYVDDGGTERSEEASVRWYTDVPEAEGDVGPGGGQGPSFLDDGRLDLSVDQAFDGVLVAVVRDGRGGADWIELPLTVR